MDIHELYTRSGELHGHLCPGLAMGVRAAAEAKARLGSVDNCVLGHSACWVDGIRSVLGIDPTVNETDTAVFDFGGAGSTLRLTLKELPRDSMDKPSLIEHILTAPVSDIFDIC